MAKIITVVLGVMLLLTSCAQVPKSEPLSWSWDQRQSQLIMLNSWQFRGHVVFKMPKDKFSANVFWRQDQRSYQIMLFGPLGFGAVELNGRLGGVSLKDSHGRVYQADDPEALMRQQLGWSLPVSSLYYWVRGLPAPGAVTSVSYDLFHRMEVLEQLGWRIHFLRYSRVGSLELPIEVTFEQGRFFMHLTIEGDSWQVKR